MIRTGNTGCRQEFPRKRTEAALHSIANDRAADLLRHCDAKPHRRIAVAAIADQQDETGHWRTAAAIGREKIRALRECL
jgi:hypothetical protein